MSPVTQVSGRPGSRGRARPLGVALLSAVVLVSTIAPAFALPSETADQTSGFDAKVRAVYSTGNAIWVGGAFDNIVGADAGPAVAIAALDPTTGGRAAGVNPPVLTGNNPIVYDFSAAGGVLYAAGSFTYQHAGQTWRNLIGIDPTTGSIVSHFSTASLMTVHATGDRVLAGGERMIAYTTSGAEIASFTPLVTKIDASLRGHNTTPQFRDIGVAADGSGMAVGQFDFINNSGQKVAVKFDVTTGAVADWDVGNIAQNSGAFGISLALSGPTLYVGAGGSDFTAAYQVSNGAQLWKTDTSGSSQAVALYDATTLVVGGHFQWVAYGSATQCGDNSNANTACLNQPRLAAVNASTGAVNDTWRPSVCCHYNGVWALAVVGTRLHIGGQFTKIDGVTKKFYARFSEGSAGPGVGLFSDGFEGGLGAWNSSKGLTAVSGGAHGGSFSAVNGGSSAWALTRLGADHTDLYARVWVKVESQTDAFQILRLKTDANANVVVVMLLANGKLRILNKVGGGRATSTATYHSGWNDIQVRGLVAGTSGAIQLWLDGALVAEMNPTSLGSTGLARVEIGNRSTGKSYSVRYDDVVVDTAFIA